MNTAMTNKVMALSRESRPGYHSGIRRNKQIARIIIHLRDQLRIRHPQLAMPTQWMIRNLVDNVLPHVYNQSETQSQNRAQNSQPDDWRIELIAALKKIHQASDVGLEKTCHFVQEDGFTPLFPNRDLFDEWDAFRFSQALLHYLEKEF